MVLGTISWGVIVRGAIVQGRIVLEPSPPFERSGCFYVTISEGFKRFQYFNFETNSLEIKNLFQKTKVLFFS